MPKLQPTAPRASRIEGNGFTKFERCVIAYAAARQGRAFNAASLELHLAAQGFKRSASASAVCSELAFSGHLRPLGLGRYTFRAAS